MSELWPVSPEEAFPFEPINESPLSHSCLNESFDICSFLNHHFQIYFTCHSSFLPFDSRNFSLLDTEITQFSNAQKATSHHSYKTQETHKPTKIEHLFPFDRFREFKSQSIPPPISLFHYLKRLVKYGSSEPDLFYILWIYADRLNRNLSDYEFSFKSQHDHAESCVHNVDILYTESSKDIEFECHRICPATIHRFIIVAMTIIFKMFNDKYYTNSYYAKVGGISTRELNHLEVLLCELLHWDLFVNEELLSKTKQFLFS